MTESAEHGHDSLSVVIPFYNEVGNAGELIAELHEALRPLTMPWEIVAVNDGSRDDTAAELAASRRRFGDHGIRSWRATRYSRKQNHQ